MPRAADRRAIAVATGVAYGCLGAVLAYVALRIVEAGVAPEPDPATLVWSGRSSFAWRSIESLYAAGMAGLGGAALATVAPAAAARWLGRAVALVALALVAQAITLP